MKTIETLTKLDEDRDLLGNPIIGNNEGLLKFMRDYAKIKEAQRDFNDRVRKEVFKAFDNIII